MGVFRKLERGLLALALVPFIDLERKERDRRLEERVKRKRS